MVIAGGLSYWVKAPPVAAKPGAHFESEAPAAAPASGAAVGTGADVATGVGTGVEVDVANVHAARESASASVPSRTNVLIAFTYLASSIFGTFYPVWPTAARPGTRVAPQRVYPIPAERNLLNQREVPQTRPPPGAGGIGGFLETAFPVHLRRQPVVAPGAGGRQRPSMVPQRFEELLPGRAEGMPVTDGYLTPDLASQLRFFDLVRRRGFPPTVSLAPSGESRRSGRRVLEGGTPQTE